MKQNRFFPEIHGSFGFGCMRLPMTKSGVDIEELTRMVDAFIGAGFNYFDTAHGYVRGASERAIAECITARYKRSDFVLADKLTTAYFNKREDIRPLFREQLAACGVEYFDFYLMHAQDKNIYKKFMDCGAYEEVAALKKDGLIRHFGISFHDRADVLETILSEHPEIEVVQMQFNYADYEDEAVESRKVYETCERFGVPVIAMEPVKGGSLVKLPPEADSALRSLNGGSNASYALRFAAEQKNMAVVLSGMSNMEQMTDNITTMRDVKPLTDAEHAALDRVREVLRSLHLVPCTACHYCIEENHCPKNILIPDLFAALNSYEVFHNWNSSYYYRNIITGGGHGKASDCIHCGKCEKVCPQHLEIRKLLEQTAKTFER